MFFWSERWSVQGSMNTAAPGLREGGVLGLDLGLGLKSARLSKLTGMAGAVSKAGNTESRAFLAGGGVMRARLSLELCG